MCNTCFSGRLSYMHILYHARPLPHTPFFMHAPFVMHTLFNMHGSFHQICPLCHIYPLPCAPSLPHLCLPFAMWAPPLPCKPPAIQAHKQHTPTFPMHASLSTSSLTHFACPFPDRIHDTHL